MTRAAALYPIRNGLLMIGVFASLAMGSIGRTGHAEARGPHDYTADNAGKVTRGQGTTAHVENEFKELLIKVEQKQQEEKDIKERSSQTTDASDNVNRNTNKAAESYQQILTSTSLLN